MDHNTVYLGELRCTDDVIILHDLHVCVHPEVLLALGVVAGEVLPRLPLGPTNGFFQNMYFRQVKKLTFCPLYCNFLSTFS